MKWKALLALAALYLSSGCGALQYTTGPMVKRQGVVAPADFDLEGRMTRANRALMEFPDAEDINRRCGRKVVKSVDKYLIPGAKKVFAHLRDRHKRNEQSDESKSDVIATQRDAYDLFQCLRTHPKVKLRIVHNEGYTSKWDVSNSVHFFGFMYKWNRDVADCVENKVEELEKRQEEDNEELRKQIKDKKAFIDSCRETAEDLIYNGAAIKLGFEKKLKLKPAEKCKRATDNWYVLLDKPENDGFEIGAKSGATFVVFKYGGAHAWGGKESCGEDYDTNQRLSYEDNLAKWNREHPDMKWSLIEITLESYEEVKDLSNLLNIPLETLKK